MKIIDKTLNLKSSRICLRNLQVADISHEYVAWMNDYSVVKYTESRFCTHTFDQIAEYVFRCDNDIQTMLCGIFDVVTELHIGNIKIGPINWNHSNSDLGIIIGRKEYWGKGYATEAIMLMRRFGFEVLKLNKMTAGVYATNIGSARAFEKAGFSLEARRPRHCLFDGQWVDALEYGCINGAYNWL